MSLDVLAIGSHPDDIEMTSAGLLVKMKSTGHSIGALHLTEGEMGSRGTKDTRRGEAKAASQTLQLDYFRILGSSMGFHDGALNSKHELVIKLAEVLRELKPKLVIAPFVHDPHPDHAAAGTLVVRASHAAELKNAPIKGEPHFVNQVIHSMYRSVFEPSFIVDISDFYEKKLEAVMCYHSQMSKTKEGEPESRLSSPQFLKSWEARHIYLGSLIGVRYAEGYFCEYPIAISNPLDAFEVVQQRRYATRPITPSP